MKPKILLTLLFAVLVQSCLGQNYKSIFGDSSTSWKIANGNMGGTYIDSLYTTDDTLVNGKFYKMIYCVTETKQIPYLEGFFREDTILGKSWFLPYYSSFFTFDTTEFLIMNLNLSVGDSFFFCVNHLNLSDFVYVDSVYYSDGRKYIQFNYQTKWDDKITFIEEIGPNISILYPKINTNIKPYVACSFKDEQLIYITNNSNFVDCDIDYTLINEKNKYSDKIIISPNPIYNTAILKFNNPYNSEYTFYLFNILGGKIQTYITYSNIIILEKEKLKQGIYFYKLIKKPDDKIVGSGKLIIIN